MTLVNIVTMALVCLFAIFTPLWFYIATGRAKPAPRGTTEPYGVGGGLRLYIALAVIFAPLLEVSSLTQATLVNPAARETVGAESWNQYGLVTGLLTLGAMCWRLWAVYGLKTRFVPRSVYHIKLYLAAIPFISSAASVASNALLLNLAPRPNVFIQLGINVALSAVWYLYFSRSKRVQNTYFAPEFEGVEALPGPSLEEAPATPAFEQSTGAGVTVAAFTRESVAVPESAPAAAGHAVGAGPLETRFEALKQLLAKGLISAEDYERKKAELLSQL